MRITAEAVLLEMGNRWSEGKVESEGMVVMDDRELLEVSLLADYCEYD